MKGPGSARSVLTEEETKAAAREIVTPLQRGALVGLVGDLGAGKSVFARAAAAALGVTDVMPSPSYTIVEEYTCILSDGTEAPLFHIDLYRLSGEDEFEMLGIEEQLSDGIALVEWIDRAPHLMERADVVVTIELVPSDPEARRLTVSSLITEKPE
ncbi:MAG: tRNA (adenosine(37)-N6)-threonylcarbamoyltransferase complex ATPase subunit type 1 TsaE [Alkalispirochaeta sp.]